MLYASDEEMLLLLLLLRHLSLVHVRYSPTTVSTVPPFTAELVSSQCYLSRDQLSVHQWIRRSDAILISKDTHSSYCSGNGGAVCFIQHSMLRNYAYITLSWAQFVRTINVQIAYGMVTLLI